MLNNHNTKTKSETLGDVELKYVSYGDTIEFAKILQEAPKDKDFVAKILFHQLVKPEVGFGDFQKISDVDLGALTKAFVKNENHTFKYFQDTGNYFNDFKQALTPIHEKYIVDEKLRKNYEPIIKSVQESLNAFNKNYASVQSIIKTQFDLWQKWAEQNKLVFKNLNTALDQEKKKFLLQNGWVLSPYLSNKTIKSELNSVNIFKKKNSEINVIYENFFSENNYKELKNMIDGWSNNKYFKNRIKIFTDCLMILQTFRVNKQNNKINPARIILPSLIAQIDGITSEYAKNNGLIVNKTRWQDSSGQVVSKFDSIWNQLCYDSSEIFTIRMLEEYLFGKAFPYGQKNPDKNNENPKKVKLRPFFQFSRHKIMHGEDLKFGTIDNVLRAFLLLDFLANLK